MALKNAQQRSSAVIGLPKTATIRNVFTYIDNFGLYSNIRRREGESTINFRERLYSVYTRRANTTVIGLTDAIAREFDLGQEILINIKAVNDATVEIKATKIEVTVPGGTGEVKLIDAGQDGYWEFPTVAEVCESLNGFGLQAVIVGSGINQYPAAIFEEQKSKVTVFNEPIPNVGSFYLGAYQNGVPVGYPVVSGSVSFNDTTSFNKLVSGTPQAPGEWSINYSNGLIRVNSISQQPLRATYTYNRLSPGYTMNVHGNNGKVLNLMNKDVQNIVLSLSGLSRAGESIISEIRNIDRTIWGQ